MLLLAGSSFSQSEVRSDPDEVRAGERLVAKIVRPTYDPEQHQATCKVFHHVFAADGRLLTKGPGGQFGHHRGIFVGWNQVRWQDKRYDYWHLNHGETQRFAGFVPAGEHGLGEGWQVANIEWVTGSGDVAVKEMRALRARAVADDVSALDLIVLLRPQQAKIELAGDPQHAGQQFRALQRFAEEDAKKVTYIRPAAAKEHGNDVWTECGWIAAVLPLPAGAVTVLRIEGTSNPQPTTWSTRAYGRFGATFTHTIAKDGHLGIGVTYVIAAGERDRDWCATMTRQQLARSQSGDAPRKSPSRR